MGGPSTQQTFTSQVFAEPLTKNFNQGRTVRLLLADSPLCTVQTVQNPMEFLNLNLISGLLLIDISKDYKKALKP